MSSPVAVIGLTFRGTDIQDLDGLFLEITGGLDELPEVRGEDTVVPGLAGRVSQNRIADRRELELEGYVRGVGADEEGDRSAYRTNVIAMQALFDPTLDPGELVASLEDGSTATINARALNIVGAQKMPSFKLVSVKLESVDPNWVIA